jgi:hypothetical protein
MKAPDEITECVKKPCKNVPHCSQALSGEKLLSLGNADREGQTNPTPGRCAQGFAQASQTEFRREMKADLAA